MEYTTIGESCSVVSGGTPSRTKNEYWIDGTIPWIKIGNIKSKYVNEYDELITEKGLNNSSAKLLEKGTILYTIFATLGEVGILDIEACTNQAIAGITINDSRITTDYLYYYLKSKKDYVNNIGRGVAQNNINLTTLKKFEIPLIDINKQLKIVKALEKSEELIALKKKEIDDLDLLIKARFVEMFGSIYDGEYELKTLPEIVNEDKNAIKRGPFGGALKKDDFVENGYLVYEQRHAIHNDFDYAKYYITQKKYDDMIGFKVVPGDLIISCSGVTLGRIAEVPKGAKEGIINQALLKLSLNQQIMLNTFFIHQFRGEEIQEILFGFSRGSGIPNMPSMSDVKSVKFICPPLELQKEYCDFVQQVDKSKLAVQQSLEKTQQLFDSLMQEYFG